MSEPWDVPVGTPTPAGRQPDPDTRATRGGSGRRKSVAQSNPPTSPSSGRHPGTKARTVWVGIVVAALVLIVLLIFIVQNTDDVTIHFFGLSGRLPIAVALLFAAIAGILLLAIPGTIRMLQVRKVVTKAETVMKRR